MTDKYHDLIVAVLTEKGELGVNEIARDINTPVSTVQKYLERQTYFKKTERRKWDLPQNVTSDIKVDTVTLMIESVENAVKLQKAQLTEMLDSIQNTMIPLNALKRGINGLIAPVAEKELDFNETLIKLDKALKTTYLVFKQYVGKCPEEYRELLLNVDLYRLVVELGNKYLNGEFNTEITSLFLQQTDTLSEDVLKVLKEYQKEA